ELYRRYNEHLRPDRVKTFPLAELSSVAVSHLRPLQKYTDNVIRWRNEWFDGWGGRMAVREKPAALICYNSCAVKAFNQARPLGILCILDQSVAHLRTGAALLREEAELHPDFADSLHVAVPDWLLERCNEETVRADCILAGSSYVRESLVQHGVSPAR